eukprot:5704676-Prymnesium_polylepis.1
MVVVVGVVWVADTHGGASAVAGVAAVACVLTGYEQDEAREHGTRVGRANDKGGATLSITVRVPPRPAVRLSCRATR